MGARGVNTPSLRAGFTIALVFSLTTGLCTFASAGERNLPNPSLTPGRIQTRLALNGICKSAIDRLKSGSLRGQPQNVVQSVCVDNIPLEQAMCMGGFAAFVRQELSQSQWRRRKDEVYRRYNVRDVRGENEVDHSVSLELLGSNDVRNLWVEPYGIVWNAYVKDHLENRLHEMVCDGVIPLAEAQYEVSTNWIRAYQKYIAPVPQGESAHYDPESFIR